MTTQNTKLCLTYRSIGLDRNSVEVVLSGTITLDQIEAIRSNMVNHEAFIANEVGLPTPSEAFLYTDGFPKDGNDHVWTGICNLDCPESMLTPDRPNVNLTVSEFIKSLERAPCDMDAEWDRLQSL